MRGGPGLGSIGAAQGDYLQATKGHGHGDYHVPVLAPSSIAEAIELVGRRLRPRRALPDAGHDPRGRHPRPGDGAGPAGLPDRSRARRRTGSSRAPRAASRARSGRSTCGPRTSSAHNLELQATYAEISEREPRWAGEHLDDAEVVLVAYGTAARVARTAVERAREQGLRAGLFRPITLWPFPADALREAARRARAVAGRGAVRRPAGRGRAPHASTGRSRCSSTVAWAAWSRARTRSWRPPVAPGP